MNRMKTWHAAVLAAIALLIAIGVIWRGTAGQKPPPMPAAYTGPPGASGNNGSPRRLPEFLALLRRWQEADEATSRGSGTKVPFCR